MSRAPSKGERRPSQRLVDDTKLVLDHVIGTTATHAATVSWNNVTGELAYPAGGVAVVYNHRTHTQSRLLAARAGHAITCLAFSPQGQYLALGESGRTPAVTIWDLSSNKRIGELLGHKAGIFAISWSPAADTPHILSVGQDGAIFLWDWKQPMNNIIFCKQAVKAVAISFSDDGTFFVTSSPGHQQGIRFWYINVARAPTLASAKRIDSDAATTLTSAASHYLMVHSAKLADHASASFVCLACGRGANARYIFGLTTKGLLCAFVAKERKMNSTLPGTTPQSPAMNGESLLPMSPTSSISAMSWEIEKWVDVRVDAGMALDLTEKVVAIAGAQGKIRLFEPATFKHIVTLPKPAPLVITPAVGPDGAPIIPPSPPVPAKGPVDTNIYPHVMATTLSTDNKRLLCIYADRSIVVWDVFNASGTNVPRPLRAFQNHDSPIWDIQLAPSTTRSQNNNSDDASASSLPDGTFMSCGDDNSIRFWNVPASAAISPLSPLSSAPMPDVDVPRRKSATPWSEEQLQCISFGRAAPGVAQPLKSLVDLVPPSPRGEVKQLPETPASPRSDMSASRVRCMQYISRRATRDRDLLVSGDRQGIVRVHEVGGEYRQLASIPAHGDEVRTLDYSADRQLLATGSTDHVIHLVPLQGLLGGPPNAHSLDDHTKAVTGVKFADEGRKLLSCSADRAIIFRDIRGPKQLVETARCNVATGTIHDMAIQRNGKFVVTCGSDKQLRVWNAATGKASRSYPAGSLGEPVKVAVDPAGMYVACGSNDKSVRLLDWVGGTVLAQVHAHSGVVTAVKFSGDCRYLITGGADGLIMRWRLADTLTKNMVERLAELYETSQNGGTGLTISSGSSSSLTTSSGSDTPVKTPVTAPSPNILPRLNIAASIPSQGVVSHPPGGIKLPSASSTTTTTSTPAVAAAAAVPPLALPISSSSPLGSVSKPSGDELPSWAQSVNGAPSKVASVPSGNGSNTARTNNPPVSSRWHHGGKLKLASELEPSGVEVDPTNAGVRRPLVTESMIMSEATSPQSPATPVRPSRQGSSDTPVATSTGSAPATLLSDTQGSTASVTPVRRLLADLSDDDATPVRQPPIPELAEESFARRDRDDDDNVIGTDLLDQSPRNRPSRGPSRLESKGVLHDDIEVTGAGEDDEEEDGDVDDAFMRDNYEEDEAVDERKMMRQSITHDFFSAKNGARRTALGVDKPSVVDSIDLSVDTEDATNKAAAAMRQEMERKGVFGHNSAPAPAKLASLVVPLSSDVPPVATATAPTSVTPVPAPSPSPPLTISTSAPVTSTTAGAGIVHSKNGRGTVNPDSNDIGIRYGNGRRCLIAHEQVVTINIITRALVGWQVTSATNGLQAVEAVRKLAVDGIDGCHQYDVILMGVVMPLRSGADAARDIRNVEKQYSLPTTPIVAISANSNIDDHKACTDAGFCHFISPSTVNADILSVFDTIFIPGRIRATSPNIIVPSSSSSSSSSSSTSSASSSSTSATIPAHPSDPWAIPVIPNPIVLTTTGTATPSPSPPPPVSIVVSTANDSVLSHVSTGADPYGSSSNNTDNGPGRLASNHLSVLPSLAVRDTQELISTIRAPSSSPALPSSGSMNTLAVPQPSSSRLSLGGNGIGNQTVRSSLARPATAYALQLQQLRQSMSHTLQLFEEIKAAQQNLAVTRSMAASTGASPLSPISGSGDEEVDQVAAMFEYGLTGLHSQLEAILPAAARASATTRTLTAAASSPTLPTTDITMMTSSNSTGSNSSRVSMGSNGIDTLASSSYMAGSSNTDMAMSLHLDRLSDQLIQLMKDKLSKGGKL